MIKSLFCSERGFQFKQALHYGLWQITLNNSVKQDAYRFSTPNQSDIKSQFEVGWNGLIFQSAGSRCE